MHELIPRRLWLGNARDARDLGCVHDTGIRAIVDLALEESAPALTRDLIYCRIPIVDSSGNAAELLATAIETTASFIRKRIPTLVACSGGMSRSPSIVAAALAIVRNQSPNDVLQELISGNPHDVSPLLWSDVKREYNAIIG
jgi:protein-tyrosine phosphatase